MVWYLVRRRLQLSINEWESLPWWQQMVYMEGLREEFYDPEHDVETDDSDDWDSLPMGAEVVRVTAPE